MLPDSFPINHTRLGAFNPGCIIGQNQGTVSMETLDLILNTTLKSWSVVSVSRGYTGKLFLSSLINTETKIN